MKLEKEVNDSSLSGTVNTYYAGNYIYKKGNSHGQSDVALTFFNSEEGYIEPVFEQETTTTTFGTTIVERLVGFEYTYQYKDHLGNIRLAYQDMNGDGVISAETEIKEENHYYPFGLKHKGYNNQITGRDHQYGYNGIEESNELGNNMLEMDLRQYDPTIARWIAIDPVTHHNFSPYQAFDNNPIFWADPNGADSQNGIELRDGRGNWHTISSGAAVSIYTASESSGDNEAISSGPEDIIFLNSNYEEIARIVLPGEDKHVRIKTDVKPLMGKPIVIDPELDKLVDAVGFNIEGSVTFGGGPHFGVGFVYFINGANSSQLWSYFFKGGNVGLGSGIGVSTFSSIFNKEEANSKFFGVSGFKGKYNGYSASILLEGSYSWSNEANTSNELWPGMKHTWTWKTISGGGGVGLQVDARYFGGKTYNFGRVF